ncbi:MAG: type II secretion system protein GspG [Cystobacterineae bacterium]|nr:type II secretion system protein GspG [Cystobacterineae bacterium]
MTLIEVIVVITIIAILTALVAVAVIPQLEDSKREAAKIEISSIMNALKIYYAKKGNYPDTAAGLQALVAARALEKIPMDPWNNPYVYINEGGNPVIISYGKDGAPGGQGDNADISSKELK